MKMYTLKETADILKLSVRTLRYWMNTKKLHAIKYAGGRFWYVSAEEIQRIQTEGKRS